MSSKKWTDEEVEFLKQVWIHIDCNNWEQYFPDRTFESVRLKAKRLKAGRKKGSVGISADWMAAALAKVREGRTLSKKETDEISKLLEVNGVEINRKDHRPTVTEKSHKVKARVKGGEVTFGLFSCTHLGSKWQQLTALNRFYDDIVARGGNLFFHAGDLTDGASGFHKGFEYGLFAHGADEQRDYTIDNYPRREGCHTHVVSGNHDLSFKKESGFNIVRAVCAHRDDMTYGGDWVADYELPGGFRLRIRHGQGGQAHARSWKLQKIIQSLDLRDEPPHCYGAGHWHYPCWLPVEQGVSAFMLPAFQGMTGYAKSLPTVSKSNVGGFAITYQVDTDGDFLPGSIRAEFLEYPELENDY